MKYSSFVRLPDHIHCMLSTCVHILQHAPVKPLKTHACRTEESCLIKYSE